MLCVRAPGETRWEAQQVPTVQKSPVCEPLPATRSALPWGCLHQSGPAVLAKMGHLGPTALLLTAGGKAYLSEGGWRGWLSSPQSGQVPISPPTHLLCFRNSPPQNLRVVASGSWSLFNPQWVTQVRGSLLLPPLRSIPDSTDAILQG